MLLPILTAATPLLDKLIGLIPDKDKAAKAKQEFMLALTKIEHEQAMAQTEINKIEAQHKSIFVAGWRPFIGWVCGIALCYSFVLQPVLEFIMLAFDYTGSFPAMKVDQLMTLVLSMLGIGAMRSYDKTKGTDTRKVGK